MKKVIKLTENDLINLVRRVITEQSSPENIKINIKATEGSSPEAKISIEKGKKVLHVKHESGLNRDQKFVVMTDYPATVVPKSVFVVFKGKNLFELGKNKIKAEVIEQL